MLATLLLYVFIASLGIGITSFPVMPVFAKELGEGGFALGMIIAAFSITRGLLQPVVGNFSDRWGRKNFLISGLFIYKKNIMKLIQYYSHLLRFYRLNR